MDSFIPKDLAPDPIGTGWAVQYGMGAFPGVADRLAPVMPIPNPEYKYPQFDSDFLSAEVESRVPESGEPNQVRRKPPTFLTDSAIRYALADSINLVTQKTVVFPGVQKVSREEWRIRGIVYQLRMEVELRIKLLADAVIGTTGRSAARSASPSVKWDAASGTITIEKNIDDAVLDFELNCGVLPTHIVIPRTVKNVVKRDPTIKALRKRTDESLLLDGDLPPEIFGFPVLVPGALTSTAAADPAMSVSVGRIWGDDNVYLVHVNPAIEQDNEILTAFGQMRWGPWGTPFAGYIWPDPNRSVPKIHVAADVFQGEKTLCPDAVYVLNDVLT